MGIGMSIGELHVRRSILIQARPRRVWQEFESFERITSWLDLGHSVHTFEPKLGGQVEMSVEIFHHGFERMGADAADELEGYEGGWDIKHLRQLRSIVEPAN